MIRKKKSYVFNNIVIATFLLSTASFPYLLEIHTGKLLWVVFNLPIFVMLTAFGVVNILDENFIFVVIATFLNAASIVYLNMMIYKKKNRHKPDQSNDYQ